MTKDSSEIDLAPFEIRATIPAQHWVSKGIKATLFEFLLILFWDFWIQTDTDEESSHLSPRELAKDSFSFFHLTMNWPMTSFSSKQLPLTTHKPVWAQPYKYWFYRKDQFKIGQMPHVRSFPEPQGWKNKTKLKKKKTTKTQTTNKSTPDQTAWKSRSWFTKGFFKKYVAGGWRDL